MALKSNRIFLAHASEDKDEVRELYRRLQAVGFNPWLDEIDLQPGQNWQIEIPKAIRESKTFIACLSNQSILKDGFVQKEFRLALSSYAEKPAGTIFLIPIRFDECQVPDLQIPELGVNLRHIQWLDYWKPDSFQRLIAAIQRCEFPSSSEHLTNLQAVSKVKRSGFTKTSSNIVNIAGDVSGSIVANTIHLEGKRSPRMNYPAGSVGANLHKKNYIQYLISRYYKYREADKSYGATRNFSYPEIHKSIESKFKVKTYFVPEPRFEEVSNYLKQRIDKTILGKNNTRKGIRNYQPFEDFVAQQQ
jgi:TIR domain-containing protein